MGHAFQRIPLSRTNAYFSEMPFLCLAPCLLGSAQGKAANLARCALGQGSWQAHADLLKGFSLSCCLIFWRACYTVIGNGAIHLAQILEQMLES